MVASDALSDDIGLMKNGLAKISKNAILILSILVAILWLIFAVVPAMRAMNAQHNKSFEEYDRERAKSLEFDRTNKAR